MPISKFPELEGALFPSSTAMELAEKRVLAQRAEAQRKEDERKAAEEAERIAYEEKQARIEAKRIENEQRLQVQAKQRAAEVEKEAERLRQLTLQKEREKAEEAMAAQEAARAQQEVERKEKLKAEQKRKAAEEERARRLDQEKQRKRQEMILRRQEEEREADIRWIRLQIERGEVKIGKRTDGKFYVKSSSVSEAPAGRVIDWIQSHEDLPPNVHVSVDEPPKPKPPPVSQVVVPKKKSSFSMVPAAGSAPGTPSNGNTKPDTLPWQKHDDFYIDEAIQSYAPTESFNSLRKQMQGILERLDQPETKYTALLSLYTYFLKLIAELGLRKGLDKESQNPRTAGAIVETPTLLAKIYKESPGNVLALTVLGLQQFGGDDILRSKVESLDIIPRTIDDWIGEMIACRLFMDFVLWRREGSLPYQGWEELEFSPETVQYGTASMYASAQQKLQLLVQAFNLPEARPEDIPTILSLYDARVEEWDTFEKDIKADLERAENSTHDADFSDGQTMMARAELENAERAFDAAQRELDDAQRDLSLSRAKDGNYDRELEQMQSRLEALQVELKTLG